MSSTSSSLLSDRRVRVTWDAENPDHYGSLPAFSPYAPPEVGCSSVPPSTPCIGKHPKDELHGYAIQRSHNGGPWTTVGHVSHGGYPQSMTWVDEHIPNSGGTMRYWIALVDKVGNVSTIETHITSQYLKPIVEDSLDPEPGLPIP